MRMRSFAILLLIVGTGLSACSLASDSSTSGDDVDGGIFAVESAEVIVRESYPMQVELILRGTLGSPCDELVWKVEDPDEERIIHVDVDAVSTLEKGEACIQIVETFEVRIPLGDFTEYDYSVWVNGVEVASF
ncbi:MAG: hypothetical protein GTO18_11500 [Anaerolineales bacterium]|nr:hypothetical protein [Anaerolineales bacterium]